MTLTTAVFLAIIGVAFNLYAQRPEVIGTRAERIARTAAVVLAAVTILKIAIFFGKLAL